ncbi:MAG: hypothetical protein VB934_04565 [Polyangiaceae bacterium]
MNKAGRSIIFLSMAWLLAMGCGSPDETDDGSTAGAGAGGSTAPSTPSSGGSGSVGGAGPGGMGSGAGLTCTEAYTDMTGDCDLLAQDCPTGFWCNVVGEAAACVASTGSLKGIGAECFQGQCAAGLRCLEKFCSPYCCPASNEPCGEGTCDVHVTFGMKYAMMCSFNAGCTLFEGNCPEGQYCHIGDADAGLAVCDLPASSFVAEGEVCKYRNDCGESQLCNKNGSDKNGENGVCRHLCKPSDWENLDPGKGGCAADRKCKPANAGSFMDLGICEPVPI